MASYFCRDCVNNWKRKKIMQCDMCETYIDHGWTPTQLLLVYGTQREAMDHLGWDVMLYPPATHRTFIDHSPIQNHDALKLTLLHEILSTPHLCSQRIQGLLGAWHTELLQLAKQNQQYNSFLKQQTRVLNLYNMVTTYQTRNMVWEAMDPLVQLIINTVPECHLSHFSIK